jgi:hypothetical protein
VSKYVRDDTHFRARMVTLAEAGLHFPTNPERRPVLAVPVVPKRYTLSDLATDAVWWSPFAAVVLVVVYSILRGA